MSRYDAMFTRLAAAGEAAFIPFTMLGDPDLATSRGVLRALVTGGSDALELGIPFSDPVADGPVIQAAAVRALDAGVRLADCWSLVREVRDARPDLPLGLLVYANLVAHRGAAVFYGEAAAAGADSVLVADLPVSEAGPFRAAALAQGIAPVFIAPPNADPERLAAIAQATRGMTYVVTRGGVTGMDTSLRLDSAGVIAQLAALGAPPAVLGFGIATPAHVRTGLALGARGVISGSAVAQRIADHRHDPDTMAASLGEFVAAMKAATRASP